MPKKIQYTNEDMRGDLLEITRQMTLEDFRPHAVVGIARGGVIAATMLSHYFGVPMITLNLSLRDNMVEGSPDFQALKAQLLMGHKLLVIDDICDSGDTLARVQEELSRLISRREDLNHMANFRTAVLWNNVSQDVYQPSYVGREINKADDPKWIVFPYEEWWKA